MPDKAPTAAQTTPTNPPVTVTPAPQPTLQPVRRTPQPRPLHTFLERLLNSRSILKP